VTDRPVLLGIDPARPDLGALDLAESLARLLGARVVVARRRVQHGPVDALTATLILAVALDLGAAHARGRS